jgi:hypothetical protein
MKKLVVGLFAAILFVSLFYSLMTDEPGQPYETAEQQEQNQDKAETLSIEEVAKKSFSDYESATYEEGSETLYVSVFHPKSFSEFESLNETAEGHQEINAMKNSFFSACKRFDGNLKYYGHEFASTQITLKACAGEDIISFEFEDGVGNTTYNRYDAAPAEPDQESKPEQESSSSAGYDPAPYNGSRHDETTSYIIAQDIVESYLKAPSTANFCRMSECSIQHLGNGEYMVIGWVEAQNSYGAMLRQEFIVTYTATEKGYTNGYCVM